MPPVRMNSLTACRRMFASGVPALPFAVSDERDGRADNLEPLRFHARYELLHARDDRIGRRARADVVDAFQQHDRRDSRQTKRSRSSRCSADGPPGNG